MPTPNRGYIYPTMSSPSTVPADLQGPLEQIDADVQALTDEFGAMSDKVAELPTAPELDQQIEETIMSRSIQEIEGEVAVPASGPRIREFYSVGEGVTMGGEFFPPDTAFVVRRRTTGGSDVAVVGEGGSWREFGMPPEVQNDHTPPTAGTLTVSTGPAEVTLTVTGAMDDVRLHQAPYRYSRDAGTTWSPWTDQNIWEFTGLTSDTDYTVQHEVRDANSNTKAGAAQTVRTPRVPVWTTLAEDDFTAADGTALEGRSTPVGAMPWAVSNGTPTITDGAVQIGRNGTDAGKLLEAASTATGIRGSFDYALTVFSGLRGSARLRLHLNTNFYVGAILYLQADGTATLSFQDYGAGGWTSTITAPTGHPANGRLVFHVLPSTGYGEISIDGTRVATVTGPTDKTFQGIDIQAVSSARVDNVRLERADI